MDSTARDRPLAYSHRLCGFPGTTMIVSGDRNCQLVVSVVPSAALAPRAAGVPPSPSSAHRRRLLSVWSAQALMPCLVPSSSHVTSGNLERLLRRRTTWGTPAHSADPKPQALRPCFYFPGRSAWRFPQGSPRTVQLSVSSVRSILQFPQLAARPGWPAFFCLLTASQQLC